MDLFTNPAGTFDSLGRDGGAQQTGHFFGLYVQDSVSIGERWNVTAGLRYDFSKLWIPGQTRRDSPWAGIIPEDQNGAEFRSNTFPERSVTGWGDLVPRLAITYDLSGRGSTLLKGSYGQYSMQQATNLAARFNPNSYGWNYYLWNGLNGDGDFE